MSDVTMTLAAFKAWFEKYHLELKEFELLDDRLYVVLFNIKEKLDGVVANQLISIKDGLPKKKTYVIAANDKESYVVYYDPMPSSKRDDAWYIPYSDMYLEGVTHWMPLPKPPK